MSEAPGARPCKACGALIFFAKTREGKAIPLDAKPIRGFTVDAGGVANYTPAPVHRTHFETCPNAADFRKKKESADGV